MNIKNTITEHYRKFFDLHAKGIALNEDDHLNIDWAEDLVKNCFIPDVSQQRELLNAFQKHYQSDGYDDEMSFDWNISNFLKAFNCS